jgi:hypothetical protein
VFHAPRRARGFFEALIADNLDVGRPANVEVISAPAHPPRHSRHFQDRHRPPGSRPGHQRVVG